MSHCSISCSLSSFISIKNRYDHLSAIFDLTFHVIDSTDDKKITKYLWEVVSGPIKEGFHLDNSGGSMLKLKGLSHGEYSIRLTVTDEQGETNSTMATVNVEEVMISYQ